jgi:hypothetical protein
MRFGNGRKKSNQVAVDWAFDLKTVSDPNKDQPAEKLVQNMIYFILNGVSPVKDAPELPARYWEKLRAAYYFGRLPDSRYYSVGGGPNRSAKEVHGQVIGPDDCPRTFHIALSLSLFVHLSASLAPT